MKPVSKVIYYFAIIFIVSWFVIPILGLFFRFQIVNETLSNYYLIYRVLSLPIAIILTLFGTLTKKDNTKRVVGKVLWTILAILGSAIFVFMGFWGGIMCDWKTSQVLYEKRSNSNVTIAIRNYGCGAYDGDIPKNEIYKIYQITPYIIYFHKTDTTGFKRYAHITSKYNPYQNHKYLNRKSTLNCKTLLFLPTN